MTQFQISNSKKKKKGKETKGKKEEEEWMTSVMEDIKKNLKCIILSF